MLVLNYVAVLLLFGVLHAVTPAVTAPFAVSADSAFWDWMFVVSVLASSWALWLSMVRQRSRQSLGLWRILKENLGSASIFFLITAMVFVLSATSLELVIPAESTLIDGRNTAQIVTFCRVPILSHPLALYILITACAYKIVRTSGDYRKGVLSAGIVLLVYFFVMYGCMLSFKTLLHDLLVHPNDTHILIMFIFWIPTFVFAAVAYVIYVLAVSDRR
jgi:hypothetical protein